jgi:hypothetical protein
MVFDLNNKVTASAKIRLERCRRKISLLLVQSRKGFSHKILFLLVFFDPLADLMDGSSGDGWTTLISATRLQEFNTCYSMVAAVGMLICGLSDLATYH